MLALRAGEGSKFGEKNFHLNCLNIKLWPSSFLIDVDLAVSPLVASLAGAIVVTHQVQALTSVDAGIWIDM